MKRRILSLLLSLLMCLSLLPVNALAAVTLGKTELILPNIKDPTEQLNPQLPNPSRPQLPEITNPRPQLPEITAVAPTITRQDSDTTAIHGECAFMVVATGTTPLTYTWYAQMPSSASAASGKSKLTGDGVQGNNLYLTGLTERWDGAIIYCEVSNEAGSVLSDPMVLTVALEPPIITSQPQDVTLKAGKNATAAFAVEAMGVGELSYQWYSVSQKTAGGKNLSALPVALRDAKNQVSGAQTAKLTLSGTALAANSAYFCKVSNGYGTVESDRAQVLIPTAAAPAVPTVSIDPAQTSVPWGSPSVTLTAKVSVTDGGTLTYQWYYGSANGPSTLLEEESSATLRVNPRSSEMTHYYWCVVTNTLNGKTATAQASCKFTITEAESSTGLIASATFLPELEKAEELDLIPDCLQGVDLRQDITRAEFAALSVKVYEAFTGTSAKRAVVNPFTDCDDTEVLKAYRLGVTNGITETTFSPDALLTRAQMATMLARAFKCATMEGWTLATDSNYKLKYTAPAPFSDDAHIGDFARDSVYFMAANKVINGYPDGTFRPKNVTAQQTASGYANASREQALVIAGRMLQNLEY